MEVDRQIGAPDERLEQRVRDPLGEEAVRIAREDPVDVDQPTLLLEVATGPGKVRRNVRDWHGHDRAADNGRVERRECAPADLDPGQLVAVDAGLQVQRRTRLRTADRDDRQPDRAAVRELTDRDAPLDALTCLDGDSEKSFHHILLKILGVRRYRVGGKISDFTTDRHDPLREDGSSLRRRQVARLLEPFLLAVPDQGRVAVDDVDELPVRHRDE